MSEHDSLFSKTVQLLFAGKFICPVKFPIVYRFLNDDFNREKVARYVKELGLVLTTISANAEEDPIFYLSCEAFPTCGESKSSKEEDFQKDSRKDFRKELKEIPQVNRYLRWLFQCLEKESLFMGDLVRLRDLVSRMSANKDLLREISNMEGSEESSAEEICKRMVKDLSDKDILSLFDPIENTYKVTGKIEYVYALHDFLKEYYSLAPQQTEPDKTPTALTALLEKGMA